MSGRRQPDRGGGTSGQGRSDSRGRGRSDSRGRGRTEGGGGRGRSESGGRGRSEARGGGRGTAAPGGASAQLDKVLTNILPATVSDSFEFYLYSVDSVDKEDKQIESRWKRSDLFNKGFWEGLLKEMPKVEKDDLRRVVYFEGSFFFSSRAIPGLENANLPLVLVDGSETEGNVMTVEKVVRFCVPTELRPPSVATVTRGLNDLEIDPTHCAECTTTFSTIEGALQHSKDKGHMPSYVGMTGELNPVPAPMNEFIAFVNLALQKAMSERLLRWGGDFFDKDAPMPAKDRNGNDLGVTIFEAITLSFGIIKSGKDNPCLALTCDLRAKVIRNKSVLDNIYEGRRNPDSKYTEQEKQQLRKQWIGEVVIYTNDKKCYTILDLDFDHSAASLPIPGKKISHADYFRGKGISLKYPREFPMIVVEGRRKQKIFFPPELVAGNELDPKVREMLPLVASFKPEIRNRAIEKVKSFLIPGTQTSTGGTLLPAVGIILQKHRIVAAASVLPAPVLMAAGVKVPERSAENWAPVLSKANFRIEPKVATQLNAIVFHHKDLAQGVNKVYGKIRDMVNGFNTHYRLGQAPAEVIATGDNDAHWSAVEKYFGSSTKSNIFVLDFSKPRGSLDPAYPVIKMMLGKSGYLSQFVNFRTYNHNDPRDERKSSMILGGVARQILQKSGVRLWWVDIPKELPLPAVFVGVDVFHAPMVYDPKTKSRGRKSSVAAIIVEIIRKGSPAPTRLEMFSKTFRREGGKEYNLGDEVRATLKEAFQVLKVTPASVIVWRDGMPETAIEHAKEEINGIRAGLNPAIVGQELHTKPEIPLAYIVCQKRIMTKLLTVDGKFGAPSGTLVTTLQGLDFTTFYINGRAPPYATAKPVRYVCMARDKGLASVPLAKLTWQQCHAYPNWTGPIKVPSVTQKAHKLAELAGALRDGGDSLNHLKYVNRDYFL